MSEDKTIEDLLSGDMEEVSLEELMTLSEEDALEEAGVSKQYSEEELNVLEFGILPDPYVDAWYKAEKHNPDAESPLTTNGNIRETFLAWYLDNFTDLSDLKNVMAIKKDDLSPNKLKLVDAKIKELGALKGNEKEDSVIKGYMRENSRLQKLNDELYKKIAKYQNERDALREQVENAEKKADLKGEKALFEENLKLREQIKELKKDMETLTSLDEESSKEQLRIELEHNQDLRMSNKALRNKVKELKEAMGKVGGDAEEMFIQSKGWEEEAEKLEQEIKGFKEFAKRLIDIFIEQGIKADLSEHYVKLVRRLTK